MRTDRSMDWILYTYRFCNSRPIAIALDLRIDLELVIKNYLEVFVLSGVSWYQQTHVFAGV